MKCKGDEVRGKVHTEDISLDALLLQAALQCESARADPAPDVEALEPTGAGKTAKRRRMHLIVDTIKRLLRRELRKVMQMHQQIGTGSVESGIPR